MGGLGGSSRGLLAPTQGGRLRLLARLLPRLPPADALRGGLLAAFGGDIPTVIVGECVDGHREGVVGVSVGARGGVQHVSIGEGACGAAHCRGGWRRWAVPPAHLQEVVLKTQHGDGLITVAYQTNEHRKVTEPNLTCTK